MDSSIWYSRCYLVSFICSDQDEVQQHSIINVIKKFQRIHLSTTKNLIPTVGNIAYSLKHPYEKVPWYNHGATMVYHGKQWYTMGQCKITLFILTIIQNSNHNTHHPFIFSKLKYFILATSPSSAELALRAFVVMFS